MSKSTSKNPSTRLIAIPNVALRLRSKRVGFVDNAVQELVADMKQLTLDWDHDSEIGVALAAIQVGEPLRLAIIRDQMEEGTSRDFTTLINPEIVKFSDQKVIDIEGCLSIPSIYGRVPRHTKIKVKATGLDGAPLRITAEGFAARVIQHEIDHMNGILFIDYIDSPRDMLMIDAEGTLTPMPAIPAEITQIKTARATKN